MGSIRTRKILKRYKQRQSDHEGNVIPCHYCGMPASTKDHILPVSLLARIDGLSADAQEEILAALPPLITVNSCGQCNGVLGNRWFRTMGDRKRAVKDYLRRKYAGWELC